MIWSAEEVPKGKPMTKTEFQKKLDQASKIVESWPNWKKNSLQDSFKSRTSRPREPVELESEQTMKASAKRTRE